MARIVIAALIVCLTLATDGCGEGEPEPACTPGASVACVGPAGCSGGQSCLADGSGFGPCECSAPDLGTPDMFVCPDEDDDGFEDSACGGLDCDDSDRFVAPDVDEIACNGRDDDCDGALAPDEDVDGDGAASPECGGNDCNDFVPGVFPGAAELCDGLDNDCDDTVDESCEPPGVTCPAGDSHDYRLTLSALHSADRTAGTSRGVNLDGRVSSEDDAVGCGHQDVSDPRDGESGVDNMADRLAPTLAAAVGEDFDSQLMANAPMVNLSLTGFDGSDESCIEAAVGDGAGQAFMGGGRLQVVTDGTVQAWLGGTIAMRRVAVDAALSSEGVMDDVVVSGSVRVEDLVVIMAAAAPDIDESLIRTTFEGNADMEPDADGVCHSISVVYEASVESL